MTRQGEKIKSDDGRGGMEVAGESPRSILSSSLLDPTNDFNSRYRAARAYMDELAKPIGSLGRLEDHASRLCALLRSATPSVDDVVCLIFAADHGIAGNAVDGGGMDCSSYPRSVTRKVLMGLERGMAGASVLARANGVHLRVVDVGLASSSPSEEWGEGEEDGEEEDVDMPTTIPRLWSGDSVVRHPSDGTLGVSGGTRNFCAADAMTNDDVDRCLSIGRTETSKFINDARADMVIFGEVGIGNTTTSGALIAALCGISDARSLCGTGSAPYSDGIDDDVDDDDVRAMIISKKASIIDLAMRRHPSLVGDPRGALRAVGGAEIASIVGGMLECSSRDVPVLVDGYIVTTSAMIASMIDPLVTRLLIFATKSTEVGQRVALDEIRRIASANDVPPPVMPALDMRLRMGEATGALLAVPLIRSACAIVTELATLNEVLSLK
ncbi:hypothetical protein ACHAXA_005792 [Cyclostephanos tholiformis]|uniref:Nicotinate-nucleotide--dimethylbenzimidazole phosphoribosyltransferase n=1 Tax=Cyclostephanos tholiformis TaxID=382380 RepID=A0ABD3RGN5_9STRA